MGYKDDLHGVANLLDAYLEASIQGTPPVIHQQAMRQNIQNLDLERLALEGGLHGERLQQFLTDYLDTTTRLHHPHFMAHQVATPHPSGSYGALVDALTNNAMAIYEMGPGAASVEYFVVNWMLRHAGWTPAPLEELKARHNEPFGGGLLTHGGSLANLTALLMARNLAAPESWQKGVPKDLVVLAGPPAHYSLSRAVSILGLGQQALVALPADAYGVVLPDRLEDVYSDLQRQGKRVMAVVANACQTAAGLYDPLKPMAQFCRRHGLWLHVDGAHGASALLSQTHRFRLDGLELADSLTWDAHKMLRAPVLCAALLTRDHRNLDHIFSQDAPYLFHQKDEPGIDFAHRTVECTKAGLGLRFFMVLGAMGEQALGQYVQRQYDLAAQAWQFLGTQGDLEMGPLPQSNILCFRVQGSDALQLAIRDQMNREGSFYLSSTLLAGKRYLRAVLMNPETTMAHIEALAHKVLGLAKQLIIT